MGTEKSKGYRRSSRCPATSPTRASTRRRSGITLRAADRPRRRHPRRPRAEVLDARAAPRTPILTAEHLDVPLDFEARRRGRLDARHPGAADLRRDHLRGARGAALDRVLQARVLRQVHAVPRGHLVAGADPGQPRAGQRQRGATSTCCSTSATTSWAARSARSATARPARSPRSIQYFRDEYLAHLDRRAAARSTRPPPPLFAAEGARVMTDRQRSRRPTWSR